jgi:DNA-binding transcriptional ArsR family regulator
MTSRVVSTASASLAHPGRRELTIEDVLHALSDPVRLQIVRKLANESDGRPCGSFDLPVGKSTASHHFRVLREAGVIAQEDRGRHRITTLRRADLDARFPGLLESILRAKQRNSRTT